MSRGKSRKRRRNQPSKIPRWLQAGVGVTAAIVVALAVVALNVRQAPASTYVRPASAAATAAPVVEAATIPKVVLPESGQGVLYIGDSWTAGYSADEAFGYAGRSAAAMGWVPDIHGVSGGGYLAAGEGGLTIPQALAALPASDPKLVIIEGGLNDAIVDVTGLGAAAGQLYRDAQAKYPNASIVAFGPSTVDWPVWQPLADVDTILVNAAHSAGVNYISPLREHWITGQNFAGTIDPETKHPGNEGHQMFADRLVKRLQEIAE